jgi:hypothetical protein
MELTIEYWYMLPISILIATIAMSSAIVFGLNKGDAISSVTIKYIDDSEEVFSDIEPNHIIIAGSSLVNNNLTYNSSF